MSYNKIYKTILAYIEVTLNADVQINEYVPNYHIADTFKNVLIFIELENMYPDIYHYIKYDQVDNIGNSTNDYIKLDNGKFQRTDTYSIGVIDLLNQYFNIDKLKEIGNEEIHNVYQKLRNKYDRVRNNMKLNHIIFDYKYANPSQTKAYKIKTYK